MHRRRLLLQIALCLEVRGYLQWLREALALVEARVE